MTHTPGTWCLRDEVGTIHAIDDKHYCRTVATATNAYGHGDANARLIAAAPDLLDACLQLVHSTDTKDWRELQNAIASARAAIAKARGE
jgi:hypothetical protein